MKAISLWQPWASLMAEGVKRYETRSWATKYRGPLLICATKGGLIQFDRVEVAKTILQGLSAFPDIPTYLLRALRDVRFPARVSGWGCPLPAGKAVALVNLVDCIRTEYMTDEQIGTDKPFGDFSPGRYAWKTENLRVLKEPFPVVGRQGLFNIDDALLANKKFKEKG